MDIIFNPRTIYVVSASIGLISYFYLAPLLKSNPDHIASSTITLGLIVAGFTATQRNVLFGMGGSQIVKFLATTNYYKNLSNSLKHCIYVGLWISVISVIPFLFNNLECSWGWPIWFSIWTASLTLVFGFLLRNEIAMFFLFQRFMEEKRKG